VALGVASRNSPAVRRGPRRVLRRLRRLARGTTALAMGLAVALAVLGGGRAYVWCAPMAEARAHCCCPHAAAAHDAIRVDCCDDRVTPSLPSTERGQASTLAIAPPALVAVLALDLLFGREAASDASHEHAIRAARAGPRERLHARASVYLI
jgi:hypothetical protein